MSERHTNFTYMVTCLFYINTTSFKLFSYYGIYRETAAFTQLAPKLACVTATCEVTSVTIHRVGRDIVCIAQQQYQVALPVDSPRVPLHCISPPKTYICHFHNLPLFPQTFSCVQILVYYVHNIKPVLCFKDCFDICFLHITET